MSIWLLKVSKDECISIDEGFGTLWISGKLDGKIKKLPTFLSYLKRYMESWRAQNPNLIVRTDCLRKKKI